MMTQFLLSAAFGIPFGGSMYLIYRVMGANIGLPLTAFAMAGATLLCFAVFSIHQKILDRRYAQLEAEIPYPIFYRTNGNFDLGGGIVKNGNICFCDAGIVCASMEETPYALEEILLQDIERMSFDTIHLHIHTKDGRLFRITLPDAAVVVELLKQKDWVG